jgi:Holliday junction resolvase RusA-like endonuclease
MTDIKIWLDMEPHAMGRPRARRVGKFIRVYEPTGSKKWKTEARKRMMEALEVDGSEPVFRSGIPLHVTIMAVFPLPKSEHRKKTVPLIKWHTKKKDIDNIAKAVLDAGNGVIWADDGQVVLLTATKMVARQGDDPCVAILARELKDGPAPSIAGWIRKE